jgi:hypothetical protein
MCLIDCIVCHRRRVLDLDSFGRLEVKKRRETLLIFAILGLFLSGIDVLADVIKLRDGSVLRGKVVSFKDQKFSVDFGDVEESTPPGQGGRGAARTPGAEPLGGQRQPLNTGSAATESTVSSGDRSGERGTVAAPVAPVVPAGEREVSGVGDTQTVLIEKKVTVSAVADWTSSEIRVQRGQRIVINASGEIDLGDNRRTGPQGLKNVADPRRPLPEMPTGGLIVVVGDDNDDYEFIGGSREFYAPHSGILFLMVNERTPQDNSGSFVAQVKILSNK